MNFRNRRSNQLRKNSFLELFQVFVALITSPDCVACAASQDRQLLQNIFGELVIVIQGSVNGGFQTVVRVLWGNEILLPPFYLNFTSFSPQFCLFLTSFLPFLTSIQPLLRHESRTTVWKPRSTDSWVIRPKMTSKIA